MYFGVQSLQSWRDESARRKKPGLIAASQNAVRSICRKGHVSQVKCKSVRPGKEAGERVGKAVPSVATPSIHPSIHSSILPSYPCCSIYRWKRISRRSEANVNARVDLQRLGHTRLLLRLVWNEMKRRGKGSEAERGSRQPNDTDRVGTITATCQIGVVRN